MPNVKRAGHKSRIRNLRTLGTEKTRFVRYLLYLFCVSVGLGNSFYSRSSDVLRTQNVSI